MHMFKYICWTNPSYIAAHHGTDTEECSIFKLWNKAKGPLEIGYLL